jgi:hypothetical protein
MSPFEYISVLVSIILGLGIAWLLTGVAELIRRWNTLTHFWPYPIWIVLVFVLHIQEWWSIYELRDMDTWSLPVFIFVITYPILLFVLANLLFPAKWPEGGLNLRAFYFEHYKKFFLCVILLSIFSFLQNITIGGYGIQDQYVQFSIFLIFGIMLLRPTRTVWVHTALAILMVVVMLIALFLSNDIMTVSH